MNFFGSLFDFLIMSYALTQMCWMPMFHDMMLIYLKIHLKKLVGFQEDYHNF